MKIYEIGTGYTPIPATMGAATEIVVEELTKAFMKMDVPVEIIDIKAKERKAHALPITEVWVPGCFAGTDVKLGVMHKLKRVAYSVCLAQKLKEILKAADEKIVLHFHNQYNMFFFLKLVPKKLREKALVAYTNHSGIWKMPWEKIEKTIKKRYFQEAECMKNADSVFVLNDETICNAVEHLNIAKGKFIKIDNGVNIDVYFPLHEKVKAKEETGFAGKKVILQVGSVCENKGQLRSLTLLSDAMKKDKNLQYAYVGGVIDEAYQERIREKARELGLEQQVVYLGMAAPGEKLNLLYNAAEATIQASEYESFSLVKIESLAAGTPVLLQEDGPVIISEGCIAYRGECFGKALDRVLSDDEELRKEARTCVVQKYSWMKIAETYQKYFVA